MTSLFLSCLAGAACSYFVAFFFWLKDPPPPQKDNRLRSFVEIALFVLFAGVGLGLMFLSFVLWIYDHIGRTNV